MTASECIGEAAKLVYHIPLTILSVMLAVFLSLLLFKDNSPFGPSVWIAGFGTGFLINRKLRHPAACWVGIIGLLVMSVLIISEYRDYENSAYYRQRTGDSYWEYLDENLFTSDANKCGNSECLGQLFFTTPIVTSVAYSLGAFVALRSKLRKPDEMGPSASS